MEEKEKEKKESIIKKQFEEKVKVDLKFFFVEMCLVLDKIWELLYDGFSVFGGGCYVYL